MFKNIRRVHVSMEKESFVFPLDYLCWTVFLIVAACTIDPPGYMTSLSYFARTYQNLLINERYIKKKHDSINLAIQIFIVIG